MDKKIFVGALVDIESVDEKPDKFLRARKDNFLSTAVISMTKICEMCGKEYTAYENSKYYYEQKKMTA